MSGYGAAFARWRAGAGPAWQAYTGHAFVEGLGRGDLPWQDFLAYLRQDYLFLIHFSRAWSLAVVKAETLAEMQAASSTVQGLLHHEMALHVSICDSAGITPADLEATEEAVGNLAYTRYVLDAGLSGDFLDLLAALAPCVIGYAEIGARLLPSATGGNPYADWIKTYGGAEYQALAADVGALIDGAIARRLGADPASLPRWQALQTRFTTACRLEAAFWDLGRG